MTIHENYSLRPHNTFDIEARCSRYVEYESEHDARQLATELRHTGRPYLIIGRGSNLLLTRDYEGTVVRSAMTGIAVGERTDAYMLLVCKSGEEWEHVVDYTVGMGLYALANLSLIPGDVGASAVQNIGAYGVEVARFIHEVRAVDVQTSKLVTIPGSDCRYGYRQSRFKGEWKGRYLITEVVYQLPVADEPCMDYGHLRHELEQRGIQRPTPEQLRQVVIDVRRSKLPDPSVLGNAGSFFVNPVITRREYDNLLVRFSDMPHYDVDEQHVKVPAAWLIEHCGWKGRSVGRAAVHHRQPLVLVNLGGATGSEILEVCQMVRHDVERMFGINLKPEVNIV